MKDPKEPLKLRNNDIKMKDGSHGSIVSLENILIFPNI